jgi:hypothetical protein
MLSTFLNSLEIEGTAPSGDRECFVFLISKRYGLSIESAQVATKDFKFDALIKLAGTHDNEFLKSIIFSTERIHSLPVPKAFSNEDLVNQDTAIWFVDCSPETFEFHCVNNKDQLLNTLLYRTKFLSDYLERDGGFGRMCDLFAERRRFDLKQLTKKYFSFIQFPN